MSNLDLIQIDPKPCNTKAALRKKHAHYPKVFLGGLPYHTTESDVRNAFERFGKVMDVIIMYDHEKNRCKGINFLYENKCCINKECKLFVSYLSVTHIELLLLLMQVLDFYPLKMKKV